MHKHLGRAVCVLTPRGRNSLKYVKEGRQRSVLLPRVDGTRSCGLSLQLTLQVKEKDKMIVENTVERGERPGEPRGLPSLQDFNNWVNQCLSGIGLAFGH